MTAHEELLYWASVNNHPLYDRYLQESYEKEHGPHFDEEYAKKAVADMYSPGDNGTMVHGEHWSIEQVKAAIAPYRAMMSEQDTCWDAYVALNMYWHDLGRNYKKRNQENSALIEDAMTWAFCDHDAPEGKIWYYINGLRMRRE